VQKYARFVYTNASAVWNVARGSDGRFGNWWAGQSEQRQVSAETHGSGVAAITCAMRVEQLFERLQSSERIGQLPLGITS